MVTIKYTNVCYSMYVTAVWLMVRFPDVSFLVVLTEEIKQWDTVTLTDAQRMRQRRRRLTYHCVAMMRERFENLYHFNIL